MKTFFILISLAFLSTGCLAKNDSYRKYVGNEINNKFKKLQEFTMEYEELSSPFQYGGQVENEFYCLQWGGDRDCQIDRDNISVHLPSFPLAETFDNYAEFEE